MQIEGSKYTICGTHQQQSYKADMSSPTPAGSKKNIMHTISTIFQSRYSYILQIIKSLKNQRNSNNT
jgi:hypothetical protein